MHDVAGLSSQALLAAWGRREGGREGGRRGWNQARGGVGGGHSQGSQPSVVLLCYAVNADLLGITLLPWHAKAACISPLGH